MIVLDRIMDYRSMGHRFLPKQGLEDETYIKFKNMYLDYIQQMPTQIQISESKDQTDVEDDIPINEKKWINYFHEHKYYFGIAIGLIIIYLLLGRVLGYIHSITEVIVFSILPLKIILHIMCNQNESLKYNQYSNILLKQMFLIVLVKTMISIIPFIELIPIIRILSYPIYLILITFALIIQVPVAILNKIIGIGLDKTRFAKNNFIKNILHINTLYDGLILKITKLIDDSKIVRMRMIRNILLKYESDVPWNPRDMNKMLSALNDLGINQIVDGGIEIKSSFSDIIKQLN